MDRKRGKYVVNIEDPGNQPVSIGGTAVCSDSSQACSPKGILNQNPT